LGLLRLGLLRLGALRWGALATRAAFHALAHSAAFLRIGRRRLDRQNCGQNDSQGRHRLLHRASSVLGHRRRPQVPSARMVRTVMVNRA
jgi:hypothetical protein